MKASNIALSVLLFLAAGVVAWLAWRPFGASQRTSAGQGDVKVISGATVITGTGAAPISDGVIVIEGTRISAVGTRQQVQIPARVIDARGKFVIPGLADMHNHLRSGTVVEWENPRPNLMRLLAWGITSTFTPAMDKDSYVWLKTHITATDTVPYARFWGTGPIFVASENPASDYSPKTVDEARADVRELKAINVDGVKILYDDMSWMLKDPVPMLNADLMTAIVDEAHRQGLKVYVHAPILAQAKVALYAGADGLLHGIISDPVDDEFIALMKKNHAIYISTLSLFEACADIAAWGAREASFDVRGLVPKSEYDTLQSAQTIERMRTRRSNSASITEHLPTVRANLIKVHAAGIPVITGTDTGLFGVVIGVSSHLELVLHAEAGLEPQEVLRLATLNAARMVNRDKDLGSIEVGKLADLVILDADPLADISNTRLVYRVVKGGTIYEPAQLMSLVDLKHDEVMQRLESTPGTPGGKNN